MRKLRIFIALFGVFIASIACSFTTTATPTPQNLSEVIANTSIIGGVPLPHVAATVTPLFIDMSLPRVAYGLPPVLNNPSVINTTTNTTTNTTNTNGNLPPTTTLIPTSQPIVQVPTINAGAQSQNPFAALPTSTSIDAAIAATQQALLAIQMGNGSVLSSTSPTQASGIVLIPTQPGTGGGVVSGISTSSPLFAATPGPNGSVTFTIPTGQIQNVTNDFFTTVLSPLFTNFFSFVSQAATSMWALAGTQGGFMGQVLCCVVPIIILFAYITRRRRRR